MSNKVMYLLYKLKYFHFNINIKKQTNDHKLKKNSTQTIKKNL